MTFLFTLIGAVIGGLLGEAAAPRGFEGAVVGALLGGLAGLVAGVVREVRTGRRLDALQEEAGTLRRRIELVEGELQRLLRAQARAATPAAEATLHETAEAAAPEATAEVDVATTAPPPPATPVAAPPARRVAPDLGIRLSDDVLEAAARNAAGGGAATTAAPEAATPGADHSPENAWEAREATPPPRGAEQAGAPGPFAFLTGANTIAKVGIAILFTGVAFLAKYAADSGLFPIELRLVFIAGVATALTVIGWRLREKRRDYALVLQGGGVAVLYLTVFAGLRLYHLLPPTLAGALLVAIAVAAAVLAVGQDARILAVIGAAGGFAAPVLASTGSGSHVALFSFYLLLNLGILAVSWFKAWRELNLLGFLFTYGIGAAWGARNYQPTDFASVEPFLVAHFALYVVVAVLFALRQPPRLRGYVDSTLVFGVPLATFALQHRLVEPYEYGAAFSVLAMAAFYIGVAAWVLRRGAAQMRLLGEAFLAIGVGFATLAVPLGLDARATAATWALEGAAAIWVGTRQSRLLPRLAGVALQLAAGVSLFIAYADAHDLAPVVNGRTLGLVLIALAALTSVRLLEQAGERLRELERPLLPLLSAYGLAAWFGIGPLEVADLVPHREQAAALLLFAAASAAVMRRLAAPLSLRVLEVPTTLLLPAAAVVAALTLAQDSHPFAGLGLPAWLLTAFVVYRLLGSRTPEQETSHERLLHPAALWLLTLVATWEAAHQVHVLVGAAGAWRLATIGLVPAAVLAIVLRMIDRVSWLPGSRPRLYLGQGLGPLAALLAAWVLFACLAHDGNPWPLPYVPLLNPLDIAVGLVLFALLAWLRRYEAEVTLDGGGVDRPRLAWRVAGLLGFVWLNAVLARVTHFWGGVPYEMDDLLRSAAYQAALAICWGALGIGLMLTGARRGRRGVWMSGAGLMVLVVLKLLVFDLANSGTVARIVSFIGIGALLLAVGFLAPVPPREGEAEAATAAGDRS